MTETESPTPPPTEREALLHQRAAEHAHELVVLKAIRTKLRTWFKLSAYSALGAWLLGTMLVVFAKGITLPGEKSSFGTPYGFGLLVLSALFAILAWRVKMRLNRIVEATRERNAVFKNAVR